MEDNIKEAFDALGQATSPLDFFHTLASNPGVMVPTLGKLAGALSSVGWRPAAGNDLAMVVLGLSAMLRNRGKSLTVDELAAIQEIAENINVAVDSEPTPGRTN